MAIGHEVLKACRAYLLAASDGKEPEPALALADFDPGLEAEGSIEVVRVWPKDTDGVAIAVRLRDQTPRTHRLFDPPSFVMMRLLAVFGGKFRFNKDKNKEPHPTPEGLFLPTINIPETKLKNLSLLRLIVDTPPDYDAKRLRQKQHGAELGRSLYDLRRSNLQLRKATPNPVKQLVKRGRSESFEATEEASRKFLKPDERGFPPSWEEYRRMLEDVYALIDRIPLGSAEQQAK